MDRIHELLSAVLEKYTRLAELDPGNWSDRDQIDTINAAYELDPDGLSEFMLLRGLYDRLLEETTFSAKEILTDGQNFSRKVEAMRELYDLVEQPEVVGLIEDFKQKIIASARAYEMPPDGICKVEEFLLDKHAVADIRLAALRSISTLEACQFVQGEASGSALAVNKQIFELWNANSLIAAMRDQVVDGISLCLIRDPAQVFQSYFVFAIRNGENLLVLTDHDEGPHPLHAQMSRRPDRTMSRRWAAHWFPYQMLDIEERVDEEGNVKGYAARERASLVAYNTNAVRLKAIGELDPPEFIWLSLMFELIEARYGRDPKQIENLSYTGEMIVSPEALVSSDGALVKSGAYRPLALAALTSADVTREATSHQWEHPPTRLNDWMEERYAAKVPESILAPVGGQQRKLLEQKHGILDPQDQDVLDSHRNGGGLVSTGPLQSLNPASFGTAEKLARDRQWVGRYNQMCVIQKLAEEEFAREQDQVIRWWEQAVEARREPLIEAAARGEFISTWVCDPGWSPEVPAEKKNILRVSKEVPFGGYVLGKNHDRRHGWGCAVKGTRASIYARFYCRVSEAIADVLGLELSGLPVWLQHYLHKSVRPYPGNSILERIDPLDWKLKNPWNGLSFDVVVAFSPSGLNAFRKRLGLGRFAFPDEP